MWCGEEQGLLAWERGGQGASRSCLQAPGLLMTLTPEAEDLDLSLLSEKGRKHYAEMQSLLQRQGGSEHASEHLSASCPRNASSNKIRMT